MKRFGIEKDKDAYTIIVGCGSLGANLANTLSDCGSNVTIIDKISDAFNKLSPSYGGIVITGDATDLLILENADIKKASAIVCVTNNDNTNIMVALLAKEMYGVKQVITRLYNTERECVYHENGIVTICPAVLTENEINKLLGFAMAEEVDTI